MFRLKWRLKCFNLKSGALSWSYLHPLLFTLQQKFPLPFPKAGWCPGKVRAKSALSTARPQDREHLATCLVGSPEAHCLWTDWLPLRKKKSSLSVTIQSFASMCANMECIKAAYSLTYPSPYPHQVPVPPVWLLFSSMLFTQCTFFADEIKQTQFGGSVRSCALGRVAKRENQSSPKWEIKLNLEV